MELIKKCNFGNVFEKSRLAPAPDSDSSGEQPLKKVGHYRADFSNGRWNDKYFPCRNELKDKILMTESLGVLIELEKMFPNLEALRSFCEQGNAEKIGDEEYNCYYNGQYANYWIRLNTWDNDYNIYCHVYTK